MGRAGLNIGRRASAKEEIMPRPRAGCKDEVRTCGFEVRRSYPGGSTFGQLGADKAVQAKALFLVHNAFFAVH